MLSRIVGGVVGYNTISSSLGKRIAEQRKTIRMKQIDLTNLMNLSQGYLSQIENGKKDISVILLHRFAYQLATTVPKLLGFRAEIVKGS